MMSGAVYKTDDLQKRGTMPEIVLLRMPFTPAYRRNGKRFLKILATENCLLIHHQRRQIVVQQ
jgi:hypothetical protein